MISHKHKFIFVHVTKTAGTTIRWAMEGNYDELHDPHHLGISEIKEKLSDQIFKSYFKFGTIRNPWDREVSRYKFILANGKRVSKLYEFTLDGFKNYLINFNKYNSLNYNVLKIDGNIGVDYIMKFENLQKDFNVVCDRIGIPRQQLPHKNKTKHKHYTEYYDDETRELVAEKYATDIEHFGYKFGE